MPGLRTGRLLFSGAPSRFAIPCVFGTRHDNNKVPRFQRDGEFAETTTNSRHSTLLSPITGGSAVKAAHDWIRTDISTPHPVGLACSVVIT